MSLSVIPLTILGQITGVSGSGDTVLYQVSFKSIDGTPLYGVTAVWTDEQAEIEALAAQKPYGVWINPIDGTFTVKFADYTYVGAADLTDDDVLAGVTPIEFITTEVSDRLLPEVDAEDAGKIMVVSDEGEWELGSIPSIIIPSAPAEILTALTSYLSAHMTEIITANGAACYYPSITSLIRENAADTEAFDNFVDKVIECCKNISYPAYADYNLLNYRKYRTDSTYLYGTIHYTYYMTGGTYNLKFEPIISVAKNIAGTGVGGEITYGAVVYYLPQPT